MVSNQDSGIEVSYGASFALITQSQVQSMNLPASLKQLLFQGVGGKLSVPEHWPPFTIILSPVFAIQLEWR
ncbi:DUF3218 family protein [Pseudomonas aeruginosa]|nr:DUF3218 family protein [Pseudomonas aeruginosa]